jgi:hypothetical protein
MILVYKYNFVTLCYKWILYRESFCNITHEHLETIGVVEHIVGFWDWFMQEFWDWFLHVLIMLVLLSVSDHKMLLLPSFRHLRK